MGKGGLNRLLFTAEEAPPPPSGPRTCTLPASDARAVHIRTVLRASPGTSLRAAVANEGLCTATLLPPDVSPSVPAQREAPPLVLALDAPHPPRPLPPVSLLLAMPRPRAARRAVRTAAQLGVSRVILTGAARVERSFFEAKLAQPAVLRRAASDGVMQAAVDAIVPDVTVQPRLWEVTDIFDGADEAEGTRRVVLHPNAEVGFAEVVAGAYAVVVAVGPEGGWVEEEVSFLERKGFRRAHLGERVLASEVAVAVAITMAHAAVAKAGETRGAETWPALVGGAPAVER